MAGTKLVNADLEVQGSIKLTTTPNNTGSILTKHTDGTISVRTPAQIKSDIGANFTAGSGLTLSGTTFSLPITISGTGSFVQSVAQNTNGITVTLGTPPNTTYSTGSLAELNAGTVSTGRLWGSNVINSWLTSKLPTVGNGTLSISAGTGLTGSGSFSANQSSNSSVSIGLSTTTQSDIAKGVTAHGWGNHAGKYLPLNTSRPAIDLNTHRVSGVIGGGSNIENLPPSSYSYSPILTMQSGNDRYVQLIFESWGANKKIYYRGGSSTVWEDWQKIATEEWVSSFGLGAGTTNNTPSSSDLFIRNNTEFIRYASVATNTPDSGNGFMVNISRDSNFKTRLAFSDTRRVYFTTGSNDTTWKELWHSDNLRSNTQNDARYLQLTGGTVTGTITAPTFSGALSGNATTATRLQTARTINGTSFNGSANITTANWGTARTLTIGNTGKSVNGSGNVAWSLSEIGALPLTGGTVTGVIKSPAPVADADLANKAYVDSRTPFNTVDVTPSTYTNKAINVDPFNNTGMTYSEGSIDFGLTRTSTHRMGRYAFKQGNETTASGNYSSVFGNETAASGIGSSAFGTNTTASGPYSLALGNNTTASGQASSAFGTNATASGLGATAFGNGTTAFGAYSSAFGAGTEATGNYSVAFGYNSIASGSSSAVFGSETIASGLYSAAFGDRAEASGSYSAAFGRQTIANEFASLAIGRYSTGGAVETEWVIGSPVFKVGNGTSSGSRSDAYVLYNDGRSTQMRDMEVTEIGQGFVLKSPNGTRWRITVDNSGNLITTAL